MRVAIITSSDSGYAGQREDVSGPVIEEIVTASGYEGVQRELLPDDFAMLRDAMIRICDEGRADLVLTTGGTGCSPRDNTPEATPDVSERLVLGIPEAMRSDHAPCHAFQSRGGDPEENNDHQYAGKPQSSEGMHGNDPSGAAARCPHFEGRKRITAWRQKIRYCNQIGGGIV